MSKLPAELRSIGELLGVELDCLVELKGEAEEAMVLEARRDPICRTLQTLPGLGPIRVAQMLPIVVRPSMAAPSRAQERCGLDIAFYGRRNAARSQATRQAECAAGEQISAHARVGSRPGLDADAGSTPHRRR